MPMARRLVVILFMVPHVDTPDCTTQACGIRDHTRDYERAGAIVVGVSPDEPAALRKFADKYGLPFTLLADPEHQMAQQYGVWAEKSMYGRRYWGVTRSTFIVAPDGTVARVFPKVSPKTHDEVVIAALGELAAA